MLFKSTFTLPLLALAPSLVLAGLEDAKFSTVLSAQNFDKVINSQTQGTLVAFFAPWCGHCKSLEPVWTKIASSFSQDDRCKVAHLDADNSANKPLATKYGVSGFPTIKFIPSGGGEATSYDGPRTEEAFLEYLNGKCGTQRVVGGALSELAGRIPSLDSLASSFFSPSSSGQSTRQSILESAITLAENLATDSTALASYYIKIMTKYTGSIDGAQEWVKKEGERLGKMAGKKGAIAGKKLDELRMKQNILKAFTYVGESAESVVEAAKSAVEDIVEAVEHKKEEL